MKKIEKMSNAKKMMKVVLFVCTGNTCRSPMAERMAKRWLASEFKVKESELEEKAGIRSVDRRVINDTRLNTTTRRNERTRKNSSNPHGSPAATHGITVMKKRGYDTTDHRSRILTKTDVAKAFRIYCVSKSHKERILKYPTACPDRVCTLGVDIPDPYGGKIEDYERCAATLEKVIPEVLKRDMKFFTAASPPCLLLLLPLMSPSIRMDVTGFDRRRLRTLCFEISNQIILTYT